MVTSGCARQRKLCMAQRLELTHSIKTYKSVLRHVTKHIVFVWKNFMDPLHGPIFLDFPTIRLEMAGIGNGAWCLSAAVCHLGSSALPYNLGGRAAARPLAELSPPRATASPRGPKTSGPETDP